MVSHIIALVDLGQRVTLVARALHVHLRLGPRQSVLIEVPTTAASVREQDQLAWASNHRRQLLNEVALT